MSIEIKEAGRLSGCDCRHYVMLGEVIDLYVMQGPGRYFRVFAYEDHDCLYVGEPEPNAEYALDQFFRDHYGKAARWRMAA